MIDVNCKGKKKGKKRKIWLFEVKEKVSNLEAVDKDSSLHDLSDESFAQSVKERLVANEDKLSTIEDEEGKEKERTTLEKAIRYDKAIIYSFRWVQTLDTLVKTKNISFLVMTIIQFEKLPRSLDALDKL